MPLDLLCMGRSSIDLYSKDLGAPFEEITQFAAYVGGSPTNIAVGARRLGLNSGILTAVGNDPVGQFIIHFLQTEGFDTSFIPVKAERRSSAVLLGIQPPDRFPLVFYRSNNADIALTIDDVLKSPVDQCGLFQFAGTNLSSEPSRSATLYAAEIARKHGAKIVLDIDFRPDQWHDIRAFGVSIRSALHLVDFVIGTEDEFNAAALVDASGVQVTHSQMSDAHVAVQGNAVQQMLTAGPSVAVQKTGAKGCQLHFADGSTRDVPGFPVEIVNILGAGDAFGAGLLYGISQGWDWYRSARLGNACGAILVTQHGCAEFMPTMAQVLDFASTYGGL